MGSNIQKLYLAREDSLRYYELSPTALAGLLDKDMARVHQIMGDCQQANLQMVTYQDANYPNKLRNLIDPPYLLYYRGKFPLLDDVLSLSMVGARNATPYGVGLATEMSLTLNQSGVALVTGMAQGIDSAVVEGALKGGGAFVSVVAGGLDVIFPKESEGLYHDVATVGCLLSEYPPGTAHKSTHFRPRNRILSGLSNGVCVVECLASGGTMLTAGIAEEQGRDLFAVPGSIDSPNSRGPHFLIQQHGAYLVTNALDILAFYREKFPLLLQQGLLYPNNKQRVEEAVAHIPVHSPRAKAPRKSPPRESKAKAQLDRVDSPGGREFVPLSKQKARFTDDQIQLLLAMAEKSHSVDGLVELSQLPAKRLLSAVTMLQMDGALEEVSAGVYQAQVHLEPG